MFISLKLGFWLHTASCSRIWKFIQLFPAQNWCKEALTALCTHSDGVVHTDRLHTTQFVNLRTGLKWDEIVLVSNYTTLYAAAPKHIYL